jgi:hypothetical protein
MIHSCLSIVQAAMLTNSDAFALRAALESSQHYSQPLLSRLSSDRSSAGLPSHPIHESQRFNHGATLNLPQSLLAYMSRPQLSSGAAAGEAQNGSSLPFGSNLAYSFLSPSLTSSDAASVALTRYYMQLLQTQQNATVLGQLAGISLPEDAATQYPCERRNE